MIPLFLAPHDKSNWLEQLTAGIVRERKRVRVHTKEERMKERGRKSQQKKILAAAKMWVYTVSVSRAVCSDH